MTIHQFTDLAGVARIIEVEGPGTNFGARLSDAETYRLMREVGDDLPFHIMAAGYGDDRDWVGLGPDDVEESDGPVPFDSFVENGWGPFEVCIEGGLGLWEVGAYEALNAWVPVPPPDHSKSARDILVEHVGEETAREIIDELARHDLGFTTLTCEDCGGDAFDDHGWSDDISHRFA